MPHTPGPWQAKLGRSMAFDVSIVNDDGHIIARTSESNGPVIATAPELLALLTEARAWLHHGEDNCLNDHAKWQDLNLIGRIDTALAKAKEAPR